MGVAYQPTADRITIGRAATGGVRLLGPVDTGPPAAGDALLLPTGDYLLLSSGDKILLSG